MSDSTSATRPTLAPHTVRFIHDLRNNIASVRAGANLLAHAETRPGIVQRVAEGLHDQVKQMLALIDRYTGADAVTSSPVAAEPSATSLSEPLKVLVADDNVDAATTLATYLRVNGHRPVVTFDGPETMRVAAADPPQVMLLDIGMPTMNGYDLAREVRSQPWGADVRLIAISGYFSAEDRERALQAGFDDLLSKPVDLDALQRSMRIAD